MAQQEIDVGTVVQVPGAHLAIIQGSWHRELTDVCVRMCAALLTAKGAIAPKVHLLPGTLELPLAAQRLAKSTPDLEAIIAFGVILKGETDHYDSVKDCCMNGLNQVSLSCDIPIINEVLPVHKLEHAAARCGDNSLNKGLEAARAALEVIAWRRANPL